MREGLINGHRPSAAGYAGLPAAGCPRQAGCGKLAAMPWTPYADWIDVAVSTMGLLLVVWLVLRPRR